MSKGEGGTSHTHPEENRQERGRVIYIAIEGIYTFTPHGIITTDSLYSSRKYKILFPLRAKYSQTETAFVLFLTLLLA